MPTKLVPATIRDAALARDLKTSKEYFASYPRLSGRMGLRIGVAGAEEMKTFYGVAAWGVADYGAPEATEE